MKVFNRNIHLKSPFHSDILIFETIGSDRIKNLIIPDQPAFVFDSKLDQIFLGQRVILKFIISLKLFKISEIKNASTKLNGILGQLWRIYLYSVIKVINPKIVITLIDNHPAFHWLCKYYEGAEFMAVQNGSRVKAQIKNLKTTYTLQHFFCFGNSVKDLYSERGFSVDHYYPIGSLLSGYYYKKKIAVEKSSWHQG